jgi:hypothetical protein
MKPGTIVNIFLDPVEQTTIEGQATLIALKENFGIVQLWYVEFHDLPDHIYERLLKTQSCNENN